MIGVLVKYTEFNVTNITVSPPLPQTATSDSPQPLCPLHYSILSTPILDTPLLLPLYSNEWGNHSILHFWCWLSFCRSAPSLWWTPICNSYLNIVSIPHCKTTKGTDKDNPSYAVFPVCCGWKWRIHCPPSVWGAKCCLKTNPQSAPTASICHHSHLLQFRWFLSGCMRALFGSHHPRSANTQQRV